MRLTSTSFQPGSAIPSKFTCEGENMSPELSWADAPAGTKTFALVLHDPDAPRAGGFTHWVLYNIPANHTQLPENIRAGDNLPDGGMQGMNDAGKQGYMGPCPPSGSHRYFVRIYALDAELALAPGASHGELAAAMRGHELAHAELMGKYRKKSAKAA
jgi:Raf kinase inhibitor-like YbhB/YbcL family protein